MVKVLWPDGPRWIAEADVIGFAKDSYFNNAPRYRCTSCGGPSLVEGECLHDDLEPIYDDGEECPSDLESAIAWLSDMGEFTFAKDWAEPFDVEVQLETKLRVEFE